MLTEGKYILINKQPVPCHDLMIWAKWNEENDRHVADEKIGDIRVSTVFLGLDHNHIAIALGRSESPILFETMVFGGKLDQEQERYCTWEEAEAGHALMVEKVKEAENDIK